MDAAITAALVIALVVIAVLPLAFGGEAMPETMPGGDMMGNRSTHGFDGMWIPTLLLLGLGGVLAWAIFGRQK